MPRLSILYPNSEGAEVDLDYFVTKHVPLLVRLLGDAISDLAVTKGLEVFGQPAAFACGVSFEVGDLADFYDAFEPKAEQVFADVDAFSSAAPVITAAEPLPA